MYGFYQCNPYCPYWQMMQQHQQSMCWGQQIPPYIAMPNTPMPSFNQPTPNIPPTMPSFMMQNMHPMPQSMSRVSHIPPPKCEGGFLYTVVPGDTMYVISRRFNVSLDELVKANPQITDPSIIIAGQQVCIPRSVTPNPIDCKNGYVYTVVKGDTLSAVARRFDLTTQDLLKANPQITDPNRLYIGQKICIPLPIPEPPTCDGAYYIVRKGETLSVIAKKYNLTVDELLKLNPQITDPNLIFTGQVICVPAKE